MVADLTLLAILAAIGMLIALPAAVAVYRRHVTRHISEVAAALTEHALVMRRDAARTGRCVPLDAELRSRLEHLCPLELAPLRVALELPHPPPELLADTLQRLALRLKRRVAFERKMLARTASGRRRGAIGAALAPLALVLLRTAGMEVPVTALVLVLGMETCGCWLLWRVARVQI
jgi:hypothetical protein